MKNILIAEKSVPMEVDIQFSLSRDESSLPLDGTREAAFFNKGNYRLLLKEKGPDFIKKLEERLATRLSQQKKGTPIAFDAVFGWIVEEKGNAYSMPVNLSIEARSFDKRHQKAAQSGTTILVRSVETPILRLSIAFVA